MKQLIRNEMYDSWDKFWSEESIHCSQTSLTPDTRGIIIDWYKQSLKQFINELLAREEKEKREVVRCSKKDYDNENACYSCENGLSECTNASRERSYNCAKEESIAHLKKLKEELN